MIEASAVKVTKGRPKGESFDLRLEHEFTAISAASDQVLYRHNNGGLDKISVITDRLMNSKHKDVKNEAAGILYAFLNSENNSVASRAETEFIKAITKGSDQTKVMALSYIEKVLMTTIGPGISAAQDKIKGEIDAARKRAGNILANLFENEDPKLKRMVNFLLLKGLKSGRPEIVEVANSVINPYLYKNGAGSVDNAADYYKILNLPMDATKAQIDEAHKELSLRYDSYIIGYLKAQISVQKPGVEDTDRYMKMQTEKRRIAAAYAILNDPEKKAQYDRKFRVQRARAHELTEILEMHRNRVRSLIRTAN